MSLSPMRKYCQSQFLGNWVIRTVNMAIEMGILLMQQFIRVKNYMLLSGRECSINSMFPFGGMEVMPKK